MAPKANEKEKLQDVGVEWENVLCSVDLHRPQHSDGTSDESHRPQFNESDWEPGRCCR